MATQANAAKAKQTDKKTDASKSRASMGSRVRIKLASYDVRLLDQSSEKIVDVANSSKAKVVGPVYLPTRRRLFCVLRSPHVNKKSREHFQLLTHQRLIEIHSPGPEFAALLSKLDLPAGVDIQVRL